MWQRTMTDAGEELFLAGEFVLPGIYRQVGGGREVRLEREDYLPASLDGRVACYTRLNKSWAHHTEERRPIAA